jgi:hypothetical protein
MASTMVLIVFVVGAFAGGELIRAHLRRLLAEPRTHRRLPESRSSSRQGPGALSLPESTIRH